MIAVHRNLGLPYHTIHNRQQQTNHATVQVTSYYKIHHTTRHTLVHYSPARIIDRCSIICIITLRVYNCVLYSSFSNTMVSVRLAMYRHDFMLYHQSCGLRLTLVSPSFHIRRSTVIPNSNPGSRKSTRLYVNRVAYCSLRPFSP